MRLTLRIIRMKSKYKSYNNASIVPIVCGSDQGTAFFVAADKLLTARHVLADADENDFTSMDEGPHYDIGSYPNLSVDHAALKAQNPDYKGWLYVPGLEISYPVVRGKDNDYYLHHTYEGTENTSGCIFIDSGCAKDMGDYNTFIYGHNMKNGSMFGSLKKLLTDPSPIVDNPYIYFYTEDGVYAYRTYSFQITAIIHNRSCENRCS